MKRRAWLRVAGTATVLSVLLAACGVRAEETARRIDDADVPFDLVQTSDAPTTTTVPTTPTVSLAFTRNGRLVFVDRKVDRKVAGDRARATEAVRQLLVGPSDAEAGDGLRTNLSADLELSSVTIADGTAIVDLTGSFGNDPGVPERRLAVAQLVFTLTEIPGISKVRLRLDGKAVDVPDAAGELQHGALRRSDFPELEGAP